MVVDPLCPSVPFLYPLKISENQRFSDIFMGYKKGTLERKGLNKIKAVEILSIKTQMVLINRCFLSTAIDVSYPLYHKVPFIRYF